MLYVYSHPHLFAHGIWDAYGEGLKKSGIPYYPPLTLVFFAAVEKLLEPVFPDFKSFLHSVFNAKEAPLDSEFLFFSLFLMKIPNLIFEFLLIRICLQMLEDNQKKLKFMAFWSFNPIVIYSAYMMGHFDLIPAFFVVLAFYYCLRPKGEAIVYLSLACGALLKMFPAAFLPFVFCLIYRGFKSLVRLALYGFLPIAFLFGVFFLISGDAVFGAFPALAYDLNVSISIGNIILRFFQILLCALLCYHALFLRRGPLDYFVLSQYFLVIYLAIYWGNLPSSTHRFVWFIPFMILYVIENPRWKLPFYLLMAVIFASGLQSRAQFFGIFAPLNPELFLSIPSLKDVTWFLLGPMVFDTILEWIFKLGTAGMALSLLKGLYFPNKKSAVGVSH